MKFRKESWAVPKLAVPHCQHSPTATDEIGDVLLVASPVSSDLFCPVFRICFWHAEPFFAVMTMPEAAVNEYRLSFADEHDVGSSWEVSAVDAVPGVAEGSQVHSDCQFGRRILASNTTHVLTATDGH